MEVWEGSGGPLEVREESGGYPGSRGGVRRPSRKSGKGQEGPLEVREGSGGHLKSQGGLGRAPRNSSRGQEGPQKSGRVW